MILCQRRLSKILYDYHRFGIRKLSSSICVEEEEDNELHGDGAFRRKQPLGYTDEQTYAGCLSFLRRNYTRNLNNVDVAVTGIPYDLSTRYRCGARFGPKSIREASVQVTREKSYPNGIDLFNDLSIIDYGDCWFDQNQPETISSTIQSHAKQIIEKNVFLFSLGGDHYSTYCLLKAHVAHYGKPLSLIQFDAHSHTSTEKNIYSLNNAVQEGLIDPSTSIQIGIRTYNDNLMGIKILDAQYVHTHRIEDVVEQIKLCVGNNLTYLTFDIDCLDPSFAPGTANPVCGGLTTSQVISILLQLDSINYVGMDIIQVSPLYDQSNITSLAAATIVYELLCLLRNKKILHKTFSFGNYPK
ncbi:unnamed protein product [Adineta steineri]|uniref:Agmatinase n=1 Tax=Adineta steineri TaxID=433720 RepID=A0A818I5M3_9BILA|nr:unnamed protein product [Adineta steineri]